RSPPDDIAVQARWKELQVDPVEVADPLRLAGCHDCLCQRILPGECQETRQLLRRLEVTIAELDLRCPAWLVPGVQSHDVNFPVRPARVVQRCRTMEPLGEYRSLGQSSHRCIIHIDGSEECAPQ